MDHITIPPGVTVGSLDPDTGRRPIYRYGEEIGAVTRWPPGQPDDADTLYSISVGGQSYRAIYRPLAKAVLVVVEMAS